MRSVRDRNVERDRRIAVERDENGEGCAYIDADAHHVDEAALSPLRLSVKDCLPRARVVVVGPILRIEIPGRDVAAGERNDALEVVERSLPKRSDGAYR